MPHRLLIIEQPPFPSGRSPGGLLSGETGFRCEQASWDSFLPDQVRHCTAHLIVAVAFPEPTKAMNLFRWLRSHPIATPTLAVLPSEPEEELLQTASEAADEFIFWPIREQELRHRLVRILGGERPEVESVQSRLSEALGLAQLVGEDPEFLRVIEKIPLIAASDIPVMLSGETGTGKELCARAIHHLGRRQSCPFIPVDCGALPEHLVENELFGHVRGAYTDAHGDQKGLVPMAEGGSLFLDEIDALSLAAQAKLLRFLQEGTYKALGAERFMRADVRVIAATNRRLEMCIREKQFRSDLYFRLNVLCLHLPPLRERRGDIGLLARKFLESLSAATGTPRKLLSPAALRKLESCDWPGNVRELFNVLERAAVFSPGIQILPNHISYAASIDMEEAPRGDFRYAKALAIGRFERAYVEDLLRKHHGNITRAAVQAGKDRRSFGRLVRKYDIDRHAL